MFEPSKIIKLLFPHGCHAQPPLFPDERQHVIIETCQPAQRRDLPETGEILKGLRHGLIRGQRPSPGRKHCQLIHGSLALFRKGSSPPCSLALRSRLKSSDHLSGGNYQPLQTFSHSPKRSVRRGRFHRLHVFRELSQLCRHAVSRNILENHHRVGKTVKQASSQQFFVRQRKQSCPQGQQTCGKVPAVHGRNIHWQQRLEGLRVVPVVEMATVPLQRLH